MKRFALILLGLAAAAQAAPDDPYFGSSGSWGQDYADQWALERLGIDYGATGEPVVVAVIDTGVDYTHPELGRETLWMNPGEQLNGIDDDRNGYIDDLVGWNFVEGNNNPWDRAGHGTHVAGIIAARTDNSTGIAGVNPAARIMPLKVLNFAGKGSSSAIAAAIRYAVANQARVINLSFGGENVGELEALAVRRALDAGVVVVVAAGNTGIDTTRTGLAALPGVVTVAASDSDDQRAPFSNWGSVIDVTAPGVDVLSLRARDSDLIGLSGSAAYVSGAAIVGGQLYRASGTSFAAAYVSGVASLLFSRRPELSGAQVRNLLLQTARDMGTPGVDALTGYGLVDTQAALGSNPDYRLEAQISSVDLVLEEGQTLIRVMGSADADQFSNAILSLSPEAYPDDWIRVTEPLAAPVQDAVLASIEPKFLQGTRRWILRLVTTHASGEQRETRYTIDLGEAG